MLDKLIQGMSSYSLFETITCVSHFRNSFIQSQSSHEPVGYLWLALLDCDETLHSVVNSSSLSACI